MPASGTNSLWKRLLHWMKDGAGVAGEKLKSLEMSNQLKLKTKALPIPREIADRLHREWRRTLAAGTNAAAAPDSLSPEDKDLLEHCLRRVEASNRNNITRTAAYEEIYRNHPELHWAFLAHMISRNGGWSMTDLQGDLLPRLLEGYERRDIFRFLERANALIFQDAYPQLLLYEESQKRGRPLFRLLPHFHVSGFMRPVWEQFWQDRQPVPLAVCLIINEQNYIEGRVVQNKYYQKQVLDTLAFQAQSLLQLNQMVLPYKRLPDKSHRLAGQVLEDFSDLKERIAIGNSLYGMLFGIPDVLEGAADFARKQPHTGSRSDYNPILFSPVKKAPPSTSYTERLNSCSLKPGAYPLYSPPLDAAWKDQTIGSVERYDWFRGMEAADHLGGVEAPAAVDMTGEACAGMHKLELAVLAAQAAGWDGQG